MERPIFKSIGTPVEDLDTPALVVDLDVLTHNIDTVHSFFKNQEAKLRPQVESHRCPAIAHMQLSAEGTIGGICVNTVGQAELFSTSGISDIFIASPIITQQKIARLCSLAQRSHITVAVDNIQNVLDLSEAVCAPGVNLSVVIEINSRQNRCGVDSKTSAIDIAQSINNKPGLHFEGYCTYEGAILEENSAQLELETKKVAQLLLDFKASTEKAGLDVKRLIAGGTHNYELMGAIPGITEVCAGSYALMDARYRQYRPQLKSAARVFTTITSRPEVGLAILDTGQKTVGGDFGLAIVDDIPNVRVKSLSAEHGSLSLMTAEVESLNVGDHVWLVPSDIGTCTNLFDFIQVVRKGKLEGIWEITARGLYR